MTENEIIDLIYNFRNELACVMDACPNTTSIVYRDASIQYKAIDNLIYRINTERRYKALHGNE